MTRFPGATNCYSEEISPAALPLDGPVLDLVGRHSTLVGTLKSMNALEGAALMVFGSYSCPMWREKAPLLKSMAAQFNFPVLFVYTREAHTRDGWDLPMNAHQKINYPYPQTAKARVALARTAAGLVDIDPGDLGPVRMVCDTIDDTCDLNYEVGGPIRMYVLYNGRVTWRQGCGPFQCNPAVLQRAMGLVMQTEEERQEKELVTHISGVVQDQISKHIKNHDSELIDIRNSMHEMLREIRAMSLLETDDEYGQRKSAERALLARQGRATGKKKDDAKKAPQSVHKEGGAQAYAKHKNYRPGKKGAARGRLVAHAAEAAVPAADEESDTVIAFGTHQHKHPPAHHIKKFDEDDSKRVFKKLAPPVFNAPRCAENVDINSRNRETKERMVKQVRQFSSEPHKKRYRLARPTTRLL